MPIPLLAIIGLPLLNALIGPAIGIAGETSRQKLSDKFPISLLPPDRLLTLKRRNLIDDATFFSQMRQNGFNNERSSLIFETSMFFPGPQDLVNWMAKEVFEPDSITKYGLDNEFENVDLSLFTKAGVSEEQARNFWRAHWQHPSFGQVVEMMHRNVLSRIDGRNTVAIGSEEWLAMREEEKEEVFDWFRLVEVPPRWRDAMTAISFTPITRVDSRRMWDLGVLDDDGVLRSNLDRGYSLEDSNAMLLFAKVERRLPDLIQLYKNGWISKEDVRARLGEFGLPEESVDRLFKERIINLDAPHRIARERDLTKAEIVKGVKKDFITFDQGLDLLVQMGYDLNEADFVLSINVEAGESPETPFEFQKLVGGYRSTMGLKASVVSKEALQAEKEFFAAKMALEEAKLASKPKGNIEKLHFAFIGKRQTLVNIAQREGLRLESSITKVERNS